MSCVFERVSLRSRRVSGVGGHGGRLGCELRVVGAVVVIFPGEVDEG